MDEETVQLREDLENQRTEREQSLQRAQALVITFMSTAQAYGSKQVIGDFGKPGFPTDPEQTELRKRLIVEEAEEFCDACVNGDFIGAIDALGDILYVVLGAGVAFGVYLPPVFEEIHSTNMAKFGPGGSVREDGKYMKPPDWIPPDIIRVLAEQMDRQRNLTAPKG